MRKEEFLPSSPQSQRIQNWLHNLPLPPTLNTRSPLQPISNVSNPRNEDLNRAEGQENAHSYTQQGDAIVTNKRTLEVAMDKNQSSTTPPAKRAAVTGPKELPVRGALQQTLELFDRTGSTFSDQPPPSLTESNQSQSRSSSPTRKTDLKNYSPRIDFIDRARVTNDSDKQLPSAIFAATKNLPEALEERINGHPSMEYTQDSTIYIEHERSHDDLLQLWDFTLKTFNSARKCELGVLGEEEWSDNVVLKLLQFSNEWCGFEETMMLVNLKTVRVSPTDLLPKNKDRRTLGKKVDYGFCPEHVGPEELKIDNVVSGTLLPRSADGRSSISQATTPGLLQSHSLSFLLEIKKAVEGLDPVPQIAVWACAGLTKMAMLQRIALGRVQGASSDDDSIRDPPTISIPCVTVTGHSWNFYMAKRRSNSLVEIQGPFLEYKTDTVLGIIKIVFALGEIQQWGNTTYRSWIIQIINDLQS